uniref:Uncharacterized protein n=1 Tax=Caenorhabditis japonica TaxID=281687 RepID=A0A8R1E6F0_CAEJA
MPKHPFDQIFFLDASKQSSKQVTKFTNIFKKKFTEFSGRVLVNSRTSPEQFTTDRSHEKLLQEHYPKINRLLFELRTGFRQGLDQLFFKLWYVLFKYWIDCSLELWIFHLKLDQQLWIFENFYVNNWINCLHNSKKFFVMDWIKRYRNYGNFFTRKNSQHFNKDYQNKPHCRLQDEPGNNSQQLQLHHQLR